MEYLIPTSVLRAVLLSVSGEDEETDRILGNELARREAEELQEQRAGLN
jgi:hypothetical protein